MRMRHLLAILLVPLQVQAAAVFSDFMVGNTQSFDLVDWETNIKIAQNYHVDAFALNMAYDWEYNAAQVSLAFSAANDLGFKLFFSFDYAGNGPWPKADVTQFIQEYGSNGA
ncbi:hypothetical protein TGAMA5MH_10345 [Trichoderma gamsii]|uniref:Glycosyl hydrolase family 71 n=1 Tax=Trichoderma gamsii TaxID=398673 RepID=A0A2K0SWW5_9HYPO|nr:hypothetical protein TGAMA5MH_10345 [Trichoderma gamsii]